MEARQLKWYLKKMAKEKGITPEEYFNSFYKTYDKENKITDIKAYRKEYYKAHKDTWEDKYLEIGNYVYFIKEADNQDEILYIGSTNSMKRRMARHKSKEKIKRCIDEGIEYRVFYLELDKSLSKEDRENIEHLVIELVGAKWNEKNKDYDKEKACELLKEVNVSELKEYVI